MGTKIKVEIGEQFGEWKILDNTPILKGRGHYYYKCKCSCGVQKEVLNSNLKRGISTNCGCLRYKNPAHNYKGLENLSQKYFSRLKKGASDRNLEFKITKRDLLDLFTGKCNLTGVEIKLNRNTEKQTASVDRINSKLGYIKSNLQWVHKRVNWMKRNMSDEELFYWCKLITSKQEKCKNGV